MQLVEFPTKAGGSIFVEVETAPQRGMVETATAPAVIKQATKSLEDALMGLKPTAEAMIGTLRGLIQPPTEIEIQFGLKLSAELGAIISSTSLEGNCSIKLKWSHQKTGSP